MLYCTRRIANLALGPTLCRAERHFYPQQTNSTLAQGENGPAWANECQYPACYVLACPPPVNKAQDQIRSINMSISYTISYAMSYTISYTILPLLYRIRYRIRHCIQYGIRYRIRYWIIGNTYHETLVIFTSRENHLQNKVPNPKFVWNGVVPGKSFLCWAGLTHNLLTVFFACKIGL